MALTNHERVGKALELLKAGLVPFIEQELKAKYGTDWAFEVKDVLSDTRLGGGKGESLTDVAASLVVMDRKWGDVFRHILGKTERSLVNELVAVRNEWAHQQPFSSDDAYRALDSAGRLLSSVSAPQADEVEKAKMELLRVRFDEQARGEKRKSAGTAIESGVTGSLKPWREVVIPHADVASGRYQQAEFAADLWQVHLGEGTPEYKDPVEFFRRTYLTESLKGMLVGAVQRLTSGRGDPVVQLQTNFGGGKTHSMLALYHLFSGIAPTELAGIDAVMAAAGANRIPSARRVVLVGNKISPGNPSTKADGTVVRTLWGELAWQLGGKKAFARLAADDANATSPGDVLRELFNEQGPCVILIDEWVAYARQLHDQSDLPGGGFETQFTFAQVLTESAKLAKNCLLVISLPASDTSGSPHAQANDVEVGGTRGREALDRLRNVVGRVESSWRPASAEEGFEIVRRRLFQPMTDPAQFKDRDVVARAFADFYRTQQAEFPPECRESDYEKRIKAAYPIHPEIFDRLYTDWSTLVKFQRTRGVLRLMAAVIHSLWEKGDRNPLILPANVSIDDARVQSELTRYLSDHWVPVIEKDVDGPNSLPMKLDSELPNLGKLSACRRVARTIYLGSAPTTAAAHNGIEDRRVKLGCVMPGESPAVFGDALRRMAGAATYLYQDGPHYWYSTQPTVTKLAEDRAEQLKRHPDQVAHELEQRLRKDLARTGDFNRIHPMPASGADVPDDLDARLVVLGVNSPYGREANSAGELAARAILESRGNTPRLYRNTLVFLAADKTRLQDLDEAARKYLAWDSILTDKVQLNLSPYHVRQAETQKAAADGAVTARLPETYQWLLVPVQASPQAAITWTALRLAGNDALAVRASKKLRSDELYLTSFAPTRLRMELERVPLWRGDHVAVKLLVEDFARYLYLPRLKDPSVLLSGIRDGLALLAWWQDSFAFADRFDESTGRYLGLRAGQLIALSDSHEPGLLVKPEVAKRQMDAERPTGPAPVPPGPEPTPPGVGPDPAPRPTEPGAARPKRYHGTVTLDATRVGRDAGRIAEEVIAHLIGLVGAKVTVTLEVEAEIPSGTPDQVVRTVTENGRTLKFTSQGFEQE
ncbi:Swt1 family HEPN domain-containing protein [Accumulibacter sp.]|uniref:Swt1 family HEPN domain-containing protein n=1 Tax=Accumulibacter sp. TaxID=2053492 RepID=UPI002589AC1B|nr:Swt1 family HEPN domain-containing protein [Accumulibacter sp.]MDS4055370.1 Swt1 family HEPN domain-containing protein [Accumulibacter sp.]